MKGTDRERQTEVKMRRGIIRNEEREGGRHSMKRMRMIENEERGGMR